MIRISSLVSISEQDWRVIQDLVSTTGKNTDEIISLMLERGIIGFKKDLEMQMKLRQFADILNGVKDA